MGRAAVTFYALRTVCVYTTICSLLFTVDVSADDFEKVHNKYFREWVLWGIRGYFRIAIICSPNDEIYGFLCLDLGTVLIWDLRFNYVQNEVCHYLEGFV